MKWQVQGLKFCCFLKVSVQYLTLNTVFEVVISSAQLTSFVFASVSNVLMLVCTFVSFSLSLCVVYNMQCMSQYRLYVY